MPRFYRFLVPTGLTDYSYLTYQSIVPTGLNLRIFECYLHLVFTRLYGIG